MGHHLRGIALLLLAGCASMGPPGGGPEDREQPLVVAVEPKSGTTRLEADAVVRFTFSEPVEPRSLQEALFVSPPALGKPRVRVRGEMATIRFAEPLPRDQMILVTLGTGVQDLHGNKLAGSYTLAVTTGDKLASGRITGTLFSADRVQGMLVGAWIIGDSADFDPSSDAPAFLTQAGENGGYTLDYLPVDKYRIICWDDRNRDRKYTPGGERLGLPWRDIELADPDSAWLELYPTLPDTAGFRLIMAAAPDNRHLNLRFTRPPEWSVKELAGVLNLESDKGSLSMMKGWFEADDSSRISLFTEPQAAGESYRFYLPGDSAKYTFSGVAEPDSIPARLKLAFPAEGSTGVPGLPSGWLGFDDGVVIPADTGWIELFTSDSVTMPLEVKQRTPNLIEWRWQSPDSALSAGSRCKLMINLDAIRDLAGNLSRDSTRQVSFTVVDPALTGSILGNVSGAGKGVWAMARQLMGGGKTERGAVVNTDGSFSLDLLPPGKWLLWGYLDANGNGRYDYGGINPWRFAERFTASPDTLEVRARWETGGVKLEFR